MPDSGATGIAVAAMAMHEALIRILIERGILNASEMRAIIDEILLQLENRHGTSRSSERAPLEAEMTAFRNLLGNLSSI